MDKARPGGDPESNKCPWWIALWETPKLWIWTGLRRLTGCKQCKGKGFRIQFPPPLKKKRGGQISKVPKVMKSASGMSVPSKTKGD